VVSVVGSIALLHVIAVWGYADLPWSEHGAWLHAVQRVAAGELPFRDFAWSQPPLALWLQGAIAAVTGTSLNAITLVTALFFSALLAAFVLYVRTLKPEVTTTAALAGLFFALAYAAAAGPALPLGTADPGVVLGVTLLLVATVLTLRRRDGGSGRTAALAGGAAALATLCAHEVWAPAAYLVIACAWFERRSATPVRLPRSVVASALVLVSGLAAVALTGGAGALTALLTASGHVVSDAAISLPSWERIVVQIGAVAALLLLGVASLWVCLALPDARAAQWAGALLLVALSAGALHMGMSIATLQSLAAGARPDALSPAQVLLLRYAQAGSSLTGAALGTLDARLERHLLPTLLPPLMLVLVYVRGRHWTEPRLRSLVLFLLGLCVAGRLWLGFEGVTWWHFLLEMPVYALAVQLGAGAWGPRAGRAVLTALWVAIAVGVFEYYDQGVGVLTRRGNFPPSRTAVGTVRWPRGAGEDIGAIAAALDAADAGRTRPVLGFGLTGGWNVFLGRANPQPELRGFWEARDPDAAVAAVRAARAPAFLVDVPFLDGDVPVARLALTHWFLEWQPGPIHLVDRPRFDALAAECGAIAFPDSLRLPMRVYDCARRATPPGSSP
jgi:hypothetical protein